MSFITGLIFGRGGSPTQQQAAPSFHLHEFQQLYQRLKLSISNATQGPTPEHDFTSMHEQLIVEECIRKMTEMLIYGEKKKDSTFFDYFCEKNLLKDFVALLGLPQVPSKIKIQILQTLSILVSNMQEDTNLYYLFSNNHVNQLIRTPMNWLDEEILAYYISFLKTLTLKLNRETIKFFFSTTGGAGGSSASSPGVTTSSPYQMSPNVSLVPTGSFPLYTEAVRFFAHSDPMVQTAVRTLTLAIFKHAKDTALQQFLLKNRNSRLYFIYFACYFRNLFLDLNEQVMSNVRDGIAKAKISQLLDNVEDCFGYVRDVFSCDFEQLSKVLAANLLQHCFFPLLLERAFGKSSVNYNGGNNYGEQMELQILSSSGSTATTARAMPRSASSSAAVANYFADPSSNGNDNHHPPESPMSAADSNADSTTHMSSTNNSPMGGKNTLANVEFGDLNAGTWIPSTSGATANSDYGATTPTMTPASAVDRMSTTTATSTPEPSSASSIPAFNPPGRNAKGGAAGAATSSSSTNHPRSAAAGASSGTKRRTRSAEKGHSLPVINLSPAEDDTPFLPEVGCWVLNRLWQEFPPSDGAAVEVKKNAQSSKSTVKPPTLSGYALITKPAFDTVLRQRLPKAFVLAQELGLRRFQGRVLKKTLAQTKSSSSASSSARRTRGVREQEQDASSRQLEELCEDAAFVDLTLLPFVDEHTLLTSKAGSKASSSGTDEDHASLQPSGSDDDGNIAGASVNPVDQEVTFGSVLASSTTASKAMLRESFLEYFDSPAQALAVPRTPSGVVTTEQQSFSDQESNPFRARFLRQCWSCTESDLVVPLPPTPSSDAPRTPINAAEFLNNYLSSDQAASQVKTVAAFGHEIESRVNQNSRSQHDTMIPKEQQPNREAFHATCARNLMGQLLYFSILWKYEETAVALERDNSASSSSVASTSSSVLPKMVSALAKTVLTAHFPLYHKWRLAMLQQVADQGPSGRDAVGAHLSDEMLPALKRMHTNFDPDDALDAFTEAWEARHRTSGGTTLLPSQQRHLLQASGSTEELLFSLRAPPGTTSTVSASSSGSNSRMICNLESSARTFFEVFLACYDLRNRLGRNKNNGTSAFYQQHPAGAILPHPLLQHDEEASFAKAFAVGKSFELGKRDRIVCTIVTPSKRKVTRYFVIHPRVFLLVQPDLARANFAVVSESVPIRDVDVQSRTESRVLTLQIRCGLSSGATAEKKPGSATRLLVLHFEDKKRCNCVYEQLITFRKRVRAELFEKLQNWIRAAA
ncbi:unnamed protein product [Amoebophrya sp. A120]|nr:unnamed protein product [Amoebophrya sp. A120]|eukprot:GSA120T00016642001.1